MVMILMMMIDDDYDNEDDDEDAAHDDEDLHCDGSAKFSSLLQLSKLRPNVKSGQSRRFTRALISMT